MITNFPGGFWFSYNKPFSTFSPSENSGTCSYALIASLPLKSCPQRKMSHSPEWRRVKTAETQNQRRAH
jgi:hypothetical protein